MNLKIDIDGSLDGLIAELNRIQKAIQEGFKSGEGWDLEDDKEGDKEIREWDEEDSETEELNEEIQDDMEANQ